MITITRWVGLLLPKALSFILLDRLKHMKSQSLWLIIATLMGALVWQSLNLSEQKQLMTLLTARNIEATAQWTQQVLTLERQRHALANTIDQRFLEEERHAKTRIHATIDRLHRDALQLRQQPALSTSGNASHTASTNDHAAPIRGLLPEDAEFLVRFAADADSRVRQLTQCQDYLRALSNEKNTKPAPTPE
ncbi:hypothetical protein LMG33818_002551 [Halomonadaceae bacterium LMG 33818]|uniref:lysis system i-spanin subunit Rz n=1 Tax=Cernens ardua TaxID=3402176 RepID=UPI003EDC6826